MTWPNRWFIAASLQAPRDRAEARSMVAWLLLAVVTLPVGVLTIARLVRVRKLSHPTVADPERLGEELLDYVSRQGRRVVDLRPFWETRHLSEADRWAVQGPLHRSGQLIDADEDASFVASIRAYALAPLPQYVIRAR